jgi:hypothetical protein
MRKSLKRQFHKSSRAIQQMYKFQHEKISTDDKEIKMDEIPDKHIKE